MRDIVDGFMEGLHGRCVNHHREEKKMRERLSEKQIDKMVKDSFPASDPPSTY